jgi:DNA-binding transcriptional LysR family regulator
MSINLHHLRLFAAVVQHGGFTRAAAKLNLSQPAISKSLNELERQLDVNLLDRTGRSIRLKMEGRTLYARARDLFGVKSAAEQELRELRGLKRGTLLIVVSTTIATYYSHRTWDATSGIRTSEFKPPAPTRVGAPHAAGVSRRRGAGRRSGA